MAILALLKDVWRHHAGVLAGRWDMVDAARDRRVRARGQARLGSSAWGGSARPWRGGSPLRARPAAVRRRAAGAAGRRARARASSAVELDDLCASQRRGHAACPAERRDRQLIDARRLALLPPAPCWSTRRAVAVVDEGRSVAALARGRIEARRWTCSPRNRCPPGHPLREPPGVLLSPHLAGSTNEARRADDGRRARGPRPGAARRSPANVVNGVAGVLRGSRRSEVMMHVEADRGEVGHGVQHTGDLLEPDLGRDQRARVGPAALHQRRAGSGSACAGCPCCP